MNLAPVRRLSMSNGEEPNYTVGYKKPPEHSRFKPGQSGNRKGRPRGSSKEHILSKLDRELQRKIIIQENGKTLKVTKLEAYLKRVVNGAINNDPKSSNALAKILPLLERFHGRKGALHPPSIHITFLPSKDEEKLPQLGENKHSRCAFHDTTG
jgi:hypothetical protein